MICQLSLHHNCVTVYNNNPTNGYYINYNLFYYTHIADTLTPKY